MRREARVWEVPGGGREEVLALAAARPGSGACLHPVPLPRPAPACRRRPPTGPLVRLALVSGRAGSAAEGWAGEGPAPDLGRWLRWGEGPHEGVGAHRVAPDPSVLSGHGCLCSWGCVRLFNEVTLQM